MVVGADPAKLLAPPLSELYSSALVLPMQGEALLFFVICSVIAGLSSALGKEHNKRVLSYQS